MSLSIFRIEKTKDHPSPRLVGYNGQRTVLVHHFVNNERVLIGVIEIDKAFLLDRDTELLLVGVIKEQQGPQQGALSYTLRSNKMDISIQLYFRVTNISTFNEYDFIQESHLSPRLLFVWTTLNLPSI